MIQLATKTLEAISQALNADKCGQFRQNLKILLPKMEDAYRGTEDKYRRHQGASGIGRDCAREIQLKWRWAQQSQFDERMLRLFNRGHLEEARFLAMLMCVPGVQLWYETEDGGQFKFSDYANHYGSALDGIAVGIPDVPEGAACYTEFKTASSKAFAKIKANGCRAEKFEHYVQMNQCMLYYKLPFSLYMVVNKDTDELYAEIIQFDQANADQYRNRAGEVIFTTDPLPRISNQPTFWKCKFCDEKPVCHGKKIPDINCRTCAHWSPKAEGGYSCARGHEDTVGNKHASFVGCPEHVFDPTLLPQFSYMGGNHESNYSVLRTRSGHEFKQGPDHVTSGQLAEATDYDSL